MPWDRSDYPADWETIVAAIRARAGDRCEWEGCRARHLSFVERWPDGDLTRDEDGTPVEYDGDHGGNDHGEIYYRGNRMVRIILTTAHTCDCHPLCGDPAHLLSLCQLHHLRLDVRLHRRSRAATRRRHDAGRGQGFLFDDIDVPLSHGETCP